MLQSTLSLRFLAISMMICLPVFQIQAQHNATLLGVPGKNDNLKKMIYTADGHFLIAGIVDNDAALYKYDCQGTLVDSLRFDLAAPSSFEDFSDLIELPNGHILAVGTANTLGVFKGGLIVHTTSDLEVIEANNLTVFDKSVEIMNLARAANGNVYISGLIEGTGLDFSDAFCARISPTTLTVTDSITVFNYDNFLEVPTSLTLVADGNLIMTGYSTSGNIFDLNAAITSKAFIRKFTTTGVKLWDHTFNTTLKNEFGRMYYRNVVQEPMAGNILACGTIFGGDTINNVLDAHYTLFNNSTGEKLDELTVVRPGSQHIYQTIPFGPFFLSGGDSTGRVPTESLHGFLINGILVNNQSIELIAQISDPTASVTVTSMVEVPDGRFAFAGLFHSPFQAPPTNIDLFLARPALVPMIAVSGPTAELVEPTGIGFSYQWYTNNTPIANAMESSFTATSSGTYTIVVTDAQGCTGSATVSIVVSSVDAPADAWALSINPNPSAGLFTLTANHIVQESASIEVFDLTGRLVHRSTVQPVSGQANESIDLSSLPDGIYLIRFRDGAETGVKKLILKR